MKEKQKTHTARHPAQKRHIPPIPLPAECTGIPSKMYYSLLRKFATAKPVNPKLAMKHFLNLLCLLGLAACQTSPQAPSNRQRQPLPEHPPPKPPPQTAETPAPGKFLDLEKLRRVDQAIQQAIADSQTPGAVLWVERKGQIYHKAYGHRALLPRREKMTPDTIFDIASLTKVIAAAPAAAKLHELGKLDIDAPVAQHLPAFAQNNKQAVTIRHLLTHTSGLRPGLPLQPDWTGSNRAIQLACAETLQTPPGTKFQYSDINYILLSEIIHRAAGAPLHDFAQSVFYIPLGMTDTQFLPPATLQPRIAPTVKTQSQIIRGTVHDPAAFRMGGVAGHAGLFSTAKDLAIFARMILNQGQHNSTTILKPETIAHMTQNQSPPGIQEQRGWGWDIDSPYSSPRGKLFPIGSYGHTGWTGTSIWIDPFSKTFVIFLANRNHPTEKGSVVALRRILGTLVAEAIIGHPFPITQPLDTLNGIDTLKKDNFAPLKGLSVGLITNHTGRDKNGQSTIDLLSQAPDIQLAALFSPEHGLRGKLDRQVPDSADPKTGLPIYSLYGKTRKPAPEQLQNLDALIFDIQDIGCRFYTYISTMGLAMEAAADAGLPFIVLDRINPISGNRIEGPLTTGKTSFIAHHPIPIRHGMTAGELAQLFNAEKQLHLRLQIIQLENWRRDTWLDQTTLPWTNPSPNMRNLTAAALYPGIGLLEMTALSVGRGTPEPFEIIGAPYIDNAKLAAELNQLNLPGIQIQPIQYTPASSTFAKQTCRGLHFTITDREQFQPIDLGLSIAKILHRDYPQHFDLAKVNRLLKHPPTIDAIRQNHLLADIKASWTAELDSFRQRRAPHLLY